MSEGEDIKQVEELLALMIEGYLEMPQEELEEAKEAFPLVCETIRKYTIWDDEVT